MKRLMSVFLLVGLAAFSGISSVRAAPQVLGVMAYNDPVPLSCAQGQCWAELVTVCLQKNRPNPLAGTAYRFYGEGDVELILTDARGYRQTVAAQPYVRVSVARGFTAVRVELTERQMRELGGSSAAITVDEGMSLVPVPVAGDPNPITEQELAYVADFLRPEADRWLKADDGRTQSARLVNRMINITPRLGRMTDEDRASLLARAEDAVTMPISDDGRRRAAASYGVCKYMVEDVGRYFSMRRCLEARNDNQIIDINTEYWRATTPGS